MGTQTASGTTDRQTAIRWMLRDLQALERMLADEAFETDVMRIGAEQEMFIVDGSWQPSPNALAVLADIADGHFTTEVGAFNLELNLDPQVFEGNCLRRLEAQLDELLAIARDGRRRRRLEHRPRRDPADDPQGRPVDRQHGPEPALPRPQQRADEPARRGLRAAHQGHRRAARAPGLGDGRGVQRQLPGAPAGRARRVRQPVQRRPAARRAGAGVRRQLADAVRQAAVGGDADRPVRAVGRHAPARPPHARSLGAGDVRQRLGDVVDHRAVPRGHHPVPAGARARRPRRPVRRARRGSRSEPAGAAPAHRHGVALEPRAATASPTASRTCASRTGCCRRARPSSTRSPTPRCGSG